MKTVAETFREVMADFPMNGMHEEVYDLAIEVIEGRTKKWTHAEANRRYREKMRLKSGRITKADQQRSRKWQREQSSE